MEYFDFIWTDEIVAHIAEHGVTPDDFEFVVCNPIRKGFELIIGIAGGVGIHK